MIHATISKQNLEDIANKEKRAFTKPIGTFSDGKNNYFMFIYSEGLSTNNTVPKLTENGDFIIAFKKVKTLK